MPTQFISLVAEDKESLQQMACGLEKLGFSVRSYHSLKAALETAFSAPPALMVFDLSLDATQVGKLLTFLRQHTKMRNIPVVIVTDENHRDVVTQTKGQNIACVSKPLMLGELVASVRTLLAGSEPRATLGPSHGFTKAGTHEMLSSPNPDRAGAGNSLPTEGASSTPSQPQPDSKPGDRGSAAQKGLSFQAPLPSIHSVDPRLLEGNEEGVEITVNGEKFLSSQEASEISGRKFATGSTVIFAGQPVPTLFFSSTQLKAHVPKVVLAQGKHGLVQVANPDLNPELSDGFDVTVSNPLPRLVSVKPQMLSATTLAEPVHLIGSGFVPDSMVYLGDELLSPEYLGSGRLRLRIPSSVILKPGQVSIQVYNPDPGGGVTQLLNLQYRAANPRIEELDPSSVPALARTYQVDLDSEVSSLPLRVKGQELVEGSVVYFNGIALESHYHSPLEICADVPPSLLREAGDCVITILYPSESGLKLTNQSVFTVAPALPIIRDIAPRTLTAGSGEAEIKLLGLYFRPDCKVSAGEQLLTPTHVLPEEITITVPGDLLASAGDIGLSVESTVPAPGQSNQVVLRLLHPRPVLESLSIEEAPVGQRDVTFELIGRCFSEHSQVYFNSSLIPSLTENSQKIQATIPAELLTEAGHQTVSVRNPEPGGGESDPQHIRIVNPQPQMVNATPDWLELGSKDSAEILLTGHDFVPATVVCCNDETCSVSFVDSEHLTFVLPEKYCRRTQVLQFKVENPPPGGGTSEELAFEIRSPRPVLENLLPAALDAGWEFHRLILEGRHFTTESKVFLDEQVLPARLGGLIDGSTMEVVLGPREAAQAGTYRVLVQNPAPGGGESEVQTLTINHPKPELSYLSPTSCEVGCTPPKLLVHGVRYVPGAMILINGSTRMTQYVNPTTLMTPLEKQDVRGAGKLVVSVANPEPGCAVSNAQEFTVFNPVPQMDGVHIEECSEDADRIQISIQGSNFNASSCAYLGDESVISTFWNSTQLVLSIPRQALLGREFVPVAVCNPSPGGGRANGASLMLNQEMPARTAEKAMEKPEEDLEREQDAMVIDYLND